MDTETVAPAATAPPPEAAIVSTTPVIAAPAAVKPVQEGKGKRTPVKSQSLDDANQQQRRSSSRSIKRKKFDDELVESSISIPKRARNFSTSSVPLTPTPNTSGGKGPAPAVPSVSTGHGGSNTAFSPTATTSSAAPPPPAVDLNTPVEISVPSTSAKRPKAPVTAAAKRRRHRNAHNNAIKDIGRWKPQDDLALVLAVQQTNDLEATFRGVKFSCRFTLKEIEDRWYALLYDPTIAKIGVAAMRQLHPDAIASVHRKALYSEEEEKVLKQVLSTSQPTLETFEQLLLNHADVFLPFRTAKCLQTHWTLIKHYHLLPDQTLLPLPRHEEVLNFSDAEEIIEKETLTSIQSGFLQKQTLPNLSGRQDDVLAQELMLADRKSKREIRQLENEIPKWQVLVDSITGVAPSDFDNQTLAVLRGRLVRYLMRSKEITLGRCTKDSVVDVDLSLEGPAFKISRKQGLIKLQPNGDFMIANTGKRPFYVDSKPVLTGGNCAKLNNNAVVEISGLRFVFLINQDLISAVRAESLKNQM